jgi:phospho-N-acetylmuramoyl-pentapeptide-transferase
MLTALVSLLPLVGIGLFVALVSGRPIIGLLRRIGREPNTSPSADIAALHQAKHNTPTLGGIIIWLSALIATLVSGAICSGEGVLIAALCGLYLLLGAADDLQKIRSRKHGIATLTKLAWQIVLAHPIACVAKMILAAQPQGLALVLPGIGEWQLGGFFIPWATFVIVATANGVNFTDGLDGLATGCSLCCCTAQACGAVAIGTPATSPPLQMLAAIIGGLLGFLYFNRHPAKVFMGDLGALPLGGTIGLVAVLLRLEWLLVIAGSVFVAESVSVAVQIAAIRMFHRRVFLCAPLHHHFQLLGWRETTIVRRFWLASVVLAILGVFVASQEILTKPQTRPTLTASLPSSNTNPLTSQVSVTNDRGDVP